MRCKDTIFGTEIEGMDKELNQIGKIGKDIQRIEYQRDLAIKEIGNLGKQLGNLRAACDRLIWASKNFLATPIADEDTLVIARRALRAAINEAEKEVESAGN